MASKRQLEDKVRELEAELSDADSRIDELEDTLSGISEQAEEALPDAEDEPEED
jgi:predicted  nucleic acid-binding Zn-ribbon protein